MPQSKIKVGNISGVDGEVNIAGRDIVKNIKTIYQRALTAAEDAARARKIEGKLLAQGVSQFAQSLVEQASQSIEGDSPYKGLLAYNLNEAEIFFGRDEAKKDLLNCIKQDHLTVLHAESGAGKSSLLQAGIAAQLNANGHLAIRLRPHSADPVEFIKRTFLPDLSQAPNLAKASLREFLRQICAILGSKATLYLLLDQFEEFYNLLKKDERRPFMESLADCLNDSSLKVRWVLSLRAEALSELAELESYGITPFKNTYRLNRLSRVEAQGAIAEPAKRYSITFEPDLIAHILNSLETNGEISPTQLQLVCSALTDELPTDKTLTFAYYNEHEGGTEGILRDYLKRQLEHMPSEEQATAWKVLRALITADRQRAVKTYDEIIQELKISGVSKKQVDIILARLVERRLLFTQPSTTETFELAHDYLVNEIELDPQEQARKAAQELLDQEARTYQRHNTLLTTERLAVIEPYRSELRFSAEAEELLGVSQKTVQQEQQAREKRRRVVILGISFASLVIITILAGWGITSSNQNEQLAIRGIQLAEQVSIAETEKAKADKNAQIALARQLAAQAESNNVINSVNNKQVSGLLMAVQSMKLYPSLEAFQVLQTNLQAYPVTQFEYGQDHPLGHIVFSPDGRWIASGGTVWEIATGNVIFMKPIGSSTPLAFSPDGKRLVSLSNNNTACVWEVLAGTEVACRKHDGWVVSVAFSSNGKLVASGGEDYTALVWDANTGEEVARMRHAHKVVSIVFSPDSKLVVTGSVDKTARVWEIASGKEISRMSYDKGVTSAVFSPDGRWVASSSYDYTARVWEAETGKEIARMTHDGFVLSVNFSPNGKWAVSSSQDRTVRVWDVATGIEIARMTHEGSVNFAIFSPDGRWVLSGGDDRAGRILYDDTARLWEAATGMEITRMTHNFNYVTSIAFSPDGKWVGSGSSDGILRVWELISSKVAIHLPHDDYVTSANFSPDGNWIVSSSRDHTVRVWEVATGNEVSRMTHDDAVYSVAFSSDSKWVVSGGADNTFRVWDATTEKEIARMIQGDALYGYPLALSPDGNLVASVSYTLRVWEANTGREVAFITHDGAITSVAFSPDSKFVATSSYDDTARVWELDTGKEVSRMTHGNTVESVDFSPDGSWVVSASWDSTARVWEAATGKEVTRLNHQNAVFSAVFSPDGNLVATASRDHTARVWQVPTGKEVAHLIHDDIVDTIAFSPDGKLVVSGGNDNTARVWDATTGREIARVAHNSPISSVAFSPDGRWVSSSGGDITIIWIWRPELMIADACSRLPRNLTRSEWARYIGDSLPFQAVCPNLPLEPLATPSP
jgi:WD40 repeat protein